MSFCFVFLQNLLYLQIKCPIEMRQTLDQILMYRRFADTELRGGSTDGGFIFDNVHSQITGSLFDVLPHVSDPL